MSNTDPLILESILRNKPISKLSIVNDLKSKYQQVNQYNHQGALINQYGFAPDYQFLFQFTFSCCPKKYRGKQYLSNGSLEAFSDVTKEVVSFLTILLLFRF